ncbi:MAG: hypothetical protein AB1941_03505 [Gemmatimonadota bacterium]
MKPNSDPGRTPLPWLRPRGAGRRLAAVAAAACLVLAGCLPTPAERLSSCAMEREDPPLVGTVTEGGTGLPLWGAAVTVHGDLLGMTEETGCYELRPAREVGGGDRHVVVGLHGYVAADTVLPVRPGRTDTVHFALRRAAPPRHRLEGEWTVALTLDRPGEQAPPPRARNARGRIVFSHLLPPMDLPDAGLMERGRYDVDLTPFFGAEYAPDVSTTVFGPVGDDFFREAMGEVFAGDSVLVVTIPHMSHGGLTLRGRLAGDSVAGRWDQNAYCCGAAGRFVMRRTRPTAVGDSLVARAWRARLRSVREMEAASREWERRSGQLRLRTLDEASGEYVEAHYWLVNQSQDPGESYASTIFSEAGGWGRWNEQEPGTYSLELERLVCGGEQWFVERDSTRMGAPQTIVTLESGARVSREVRINSAAVAPVGPRGSAGGARCADP